jgi:hypothetical protein
MLRTAAVKHPRHPEALYRCAPITRVPFGTGRELVLCRGDNETHCMETASVEALARWSRFRTPSAHLAQLTAELGSHAEEALRQRETWPPDQRLVSFEDFLSAASVTGARDQDHDPTPISWVCVPTKGRTESLARCVESYSENAIRFGHKPRLLIADGEEGRDAVANAIHNTRYASQLAGVYLGPKERLRLAERLGTRGIPVPVARFALAPEHTDGVITTGLNRNAILLYTHGTLGLSVDDDTTCRLARVPNASVTTLRFAEDGEFGETWFFSDRESVLRHAAETTIDLLEEHRQVLGRRISDVITAAAASGAIEPGGLCEHLFDALLAGRGRIALSLTGLAGDCGSNNAQWVGLYLGENGRRRLDSADALTSAVSSREVLRQMLVTTVGHASPFLGTFFGFDNRQLLPPFFPFGRNQDALFGWMAARYFPDCYAAHLPFMSAHLPDVGRRYDDRYGFRTTVADTILWTLSTWNGMASGRPPSDILQSVGRHLIEYASATQPEFDAAMRLLMLRRAALLMQNLEQNVMRARADGATHWQAEYAKRIDILQREATAPNWAVPRDLPTPDALSDSSGTLRGLMRSFGELLIWWPAMLQEAKQLCCEEGAHAVPLC